MPEIISAVLIRVIAGVVSALILGLINRWFLRATCCCTAAIAN